MSIIFNKSAWKWTGTVIILTAALACVGLITAKKVLDRTVEQERSPSFGEISSSTAVNTVVDNNSVKPESNNDKLNNERTSKTESPPSEYLLPDSNINLLTEARLWNWDNPSLKLARNELYARHGYIFRDRDLKDYFERKSWYKPNASYAGRLTETEQKNVDLIKKMEALKDKDRFLAASSKGRLQFDLNGDGRSEKIYYELTKDVNGNLNKYKLTVNDISLEGNLNNGLEEFRIVDIDSKDKYKEIAIEENGPSDDPVTTFYYYNGKSLQLVGKVQGLCGNKNSVKGSGKVTSNTRTDILMTWLYIDEFKLDSSHRLQHSTKDFYPSLCNPELKVKKELQLYASPATRSSVLILKPGDVVYLMGTDAKEWCLIKASNGKEGWFAVKSDDSIQDTGLKSSDVFQGIIRFD